MVAGQSADKTNVHTSLFLCAYGPREGAPNPNPFIWFTENKLSHFPSLLLVLAPLCLFGASAKAVSKGVRKRYGGEIVLHKVLGF